ncbi:hypothetical protein GCM10023224_33880 [Streptomonospora halophila]|uniref:Uncharacterized protein n=1 Tax=Streptomonospora halophila TaxID=427369 RepID=A0ABP9GMT1_9ACTN
MQLPPFLDGLYRGLLSDTVGGAFVFTGPQGQAVAARCVPGPVLAPGFTFNEGRHTHRTWLAEEGVPEVARAARLGHRVRGMGEVYDHVTPAMKEKVRTVLDARWQRSLHTLKEAEREWVVETVPRLGEYYRAPGEKRASWGSGRRSSPGSLHASGSEKGKGRRSGL